MLDSNHLPTDRSDSANLSNNSAGVQRELLEQYKIPARSKGDEVDSLRDLINDQACPPLGLWVGKDNKVQRTGKDCDFIIVPMTQDEINKEKASKEFWNSPQGKKFRETLERIIP